MARSAPPGGPAVTAIVAHGLIRTGRSVSDPVVSKALGYVQKSVHPDGGIYGEGSRHKNYETCACLSAFAAANADGRYTQLIDKANAFLRGMQWDEKNKVARSSDQFGGAGYGDATRPDLSNTSFLIDALKSAGAKPDDPALQNALVFVSRCQNLETEHNDTPFASKNPDGGFYYTPSGGGGSPAGQTADHGLRSYGSMTYAGLKSMIYAGVSPDDPRVKAAVKWVQAHYDFDENPGMQETPGMKDAGLYYYYHAMAKALDAIGSDTFEDAQGGKHAWRARPDRGARQTAAARRLVDQREQTLDGERSEPGHRLRAARRFPTASRRNETGLVGFGDCLTVPFPPSCRPCPKASPRWLPHAAYGFGSGIFRPAGADRGPRAVGQIPGPPGGGLVDGRPDSRDRSLCRPARPGLPRRQGAHSPHLGPVRPGRRLVRLLHLRHPLDAERRHRVRWFSGRRPAARGRRLARPGPADQGPQIDRRLNGRPASPASGLWIEDRGETIPRTRVRRTPRIGVDYAGPWAAKPYRFLLAPAGPKRAARP